ncbi:uncharacterized protein LOC113381098 [Ctenocephalides felis]|uniref:uncharacterized protein LOC113381098 n=1 Tax=Ctenocephalides felis TaxID=7515 RepID=UPI000E6E28F7|nr:uncharacterized protein LOC113381098 [Ctenocephalides felis]
MAELTLKEARDIIKSFDGSSNSNLNDFLRICQYAFDAIETSQHSSLFKYIFNVKLEGKAAQSVRYRSIENFKQLKQTLEELFVDHRSVSSLQVEFNQCRQSSREKVLDYSERLSNILEQLIEATTRQSRNPEKDPYISELLRYQALNIFQEGLHPDLRILIKSKNLQSLEKAISAAIEEERLSSCHESSIPFYSNFQESSNSITISCNYCKNIGHNIKECKKRMFKEQIRSNSNIKSSNPNFSQTSNVPDSNYSKPSRSNSNISTVAELKKAQVSLISSSSMSIFKSFESPHSTSEKLNLMIDTGADVSLVKLSALKDSLNIITNSDNIIKVSGITGHSFRTLGVAKISFY